MKPGKRKRQAHANGGGTGPAPSDRPQKAVADLLLFLAIVGTAFSLRMIYISQLQSSPLFDAPQMDAAYHDQWAHALVSGETFVEGPYFRAPLYPIFLAAVYKVFGHDYMVARLIQSLVGSLSCGLVFLIGRRAFGRLVGGLAGFAAASYWVLIYFDGELLIPALIVFLDLVMILLLLRALRSPSRISHLLPGLALGLSAIARPNVLLFAPAVVLWLVVVYRPAWRRSLTYAGFFGLGCVLVILPVTVRNYVVGKDRVLIASQGGVNFYIGNNPASDGHTAIVPGTPGDWWGGYRASIARAEQAMGRSLAPSEVSRYYYRQAAAFWWNQPGKALELTARKLWLFWNRREISNNKGMYFWTERFTPVVRWLPLGFGVIGPLGITGLVLCWRRRRDLFPVCGFVVVYMISVVLFFCTARYRVPVLGPLMLLAAHASVCLVNAVRQKRWQDVGLQLAVLVPAALFVNAVPARSRSSSDVQSLRMLALAYVEHGDLAAALEHYEAAVRADPTNLSARYDLGTTLAQLGLLSEAAEQFQAALRYTSDLRRGETAADVMKVHYNLASALAQQDEHEQAVLHYRKAIELDRTGGDVAAHFSLGVTLAKLGRDKEAIDAFQLAAARDPNHQDAQFNLAWMLAKSGMLDEATVHYQTALRINPNDAQAWYELGRTQGQRGRWREAADALGRSVQIHPDNTSAVDALGLALIQDGRYSVARDVLSRAVHLQNEQLINRLAWLLATCPDGAVRDGAEAVRYAKRLCPDMADCSPLHLDTLAAAYAEAGQFEQATDIARLAIDRARARGNDALVRSITPRLDLYEAGKPYHQPHLVEPAP